MAADKSSPKVKPALRGHFHQAAFFFALGACAMLIARVSSTRSAEVTGAIVIYSLGLAVLFGVSALYHRPQWKPNARAFMRRLDHSAIFFLIASTFTPFCVLALSAQDGKRLFLIVWSTCLLGVLQSIFWIRAPKWIAAILYLIAGWTVLPFIPELRTVIGPTDLMLMFAGGVSYTIGAVVYAVKRPNPYPLYAGYHEIFHLLVILGALFHFLAINHLVG